MRKEKYITRAVGEKVNGFFVRLPPYNKGRYAKLKSFPISKSTVEKTFNKAIRYRNQYLKKNNLLHLLKQKDQKSIINSNNKSGINGITRQKRYKYGYVHHYWVAQWCIKGKVRNQAFNVDTYGEKGAFLWALDKRYRMKGPIMIVDKNKRKSWPCAVPRCYTE